MATKTVEELFRHRNIVGVKSRIKAPVTPMSSYYGVNGTKGRDYSPTREFSADIYNNTRLLPKIKPPKTAPAKRRRHPVGSMECHIIRIHEEVDVFYEDIEKYRPLGGQVGELTPNGQQWLGREVSRAVQRHANGIEFMFSRMFRSGFGVLKNDESYDLVEKSASGYTFNVDYPIPAGNLTNVGGIFSDLWSSSSTDIVEQFLALNAYAIQISGYMPQIAWINSATLALMYQNTVLRAVQGSYVRIFDIQENRELETIPGPARSSGYMVKFTALPNITFIVTDECLNVNQEVDSTTTGNSSKIIPDGKMIVTPMGGKGDWYDMVESGEPVIELPRRPNPVQRVGFYSWQCPSEKPPMVSLTILDNVIPVLYNPSAVFYVDIWTP